MPGAQTELTRRLEISRRQFFQWHLVERLHLPDVKKRMDELTNALVDADYHFNFVAEHVSPLSTRIELADNESCYREKHWKSRSRTWNVTRAKTAWEVKHHQKGRDLPIPAEIATLPVWVEWGQDVGDWRNNRSNEEA